MSATIVPQSSAMTAAERTAVASLGALYAVRMLGLFMVLPVIAIYLGAYPGYSPAILGLALGAYGLTQALLQIPFGLWSDRWGRKPVITIGLLVFFIGSVVAATADTAVGVVIGRAIQGAGAVASTVLALVADLTREEQRSKAMAAIGMSIGLTFALSLILGPLVSATYGLVGLFWFTAVLSLLAIGLLWFAVPSQPKVVNKEVSPAKELFGRVLADKDLLRLNLGIFSLHFVLTALFSIIPILLVDVLAVNVQAHWKVYLPVLGLSFVLMLPAMIYADKSGNLKRVFCAAVAVLLAALLLLALGAANGIVLVTALFVFFVGFNLLEALLPSMVSRQVFAGGRGTAMGVYSTCQFLGIFAGGALSGLAMALYGPVAIFILCGLVLFVWLSVALGMSVPVVGKTIVISLNDKGLELEKLTDNLLAIEGVLDVMIDSSAALMYLKTSPAQFNRASFDRVMAGQG
ncbi:MAG: MFS family permease [Porticoccus sp.]|jgi:MFS family permease